MTKSKVVREQGSLKLPGQSDPDFAKLVHEYLANFRSFRLKKDHAQKEQLYEWCSQNLGQKYKDWFIHEGGKYDKWWAIHIRHPKKETWFVLRWNELIIDPIDK